MEGETGLEDSGYNLSEKNTEHSTPLDTIPKWRKTSANTRQCNGFATVLNYFGMLSTAVG